MEVLNNSEVDEPYQIVSGVALLVYLHPDLLHLVLYLLLLLIVHVATGLIFPVRDASRWMVCVRDFIERKLHIGKVCVRDYRNWIVTFGHREGLCCLTCFP